MLLDIILHFNFCPLSQLINVVLWSLVHVTAAMVSAAVTYLSLHQAAKETCDTKWQLLSFIHLGASLSHFNYFLIKLLFTLK